MVVIKTLFSPYALLNNAFCQHLSLAASFFFSYVIITNITVPPSLLVEVPFQHKGDPGEGEGKGGREGKEIGVKDCVGMWWNSRKRECLHHF